MKDVSIITPVYKGNRFLLLLLQNISSVAENAKKYSIEWIIVNDYPEEDIIPLKSNSTNLSIRIINNSKNVGIQKSRIKGLKSSKGKYILFLDQDDKIDSQTLKVHMDTIRDKDVSISNGFNQIGNKFIPVFKNLKQMTLLNKLSIYFYIGNLIVSPGMALIRKNAIPNLWIENVLKINGADDWLLWVLLIKTKAKFSFIDKKLYFHIKTPFNTSDNIKQMIDSSNEAVNKYIYFFPDDIKLSKVYKRKLKMWNNYALKGRKKGMEYFFNPDIAFYTLMYKIL